jgi:hypothetical protein
MEPLLPVLPRGSGLVPAGSAESEVPVGPATASARPVTGSIACRVGWATSACHRARRVGEVGPNQTVTTGFASGSRCGQFKSSR